MATAVIYYTEVNQRLDFCKSRHMKLIITQQVARRWDMHELEDLFRARVRHRIKKDSAVRIQRIIIGGAYISAN